MMSHAEALLAGLPETSGNIDWPLLLLLARTEAALTWPDDMSRDGFDLSLPAGLDLRHPGDVDWVSQVADLADGGYGSARLAPGGYPA